MGGGGYAVKKQGDATVVLVGPPSVGKSTLLNKLTNAKSKIAPYAFTTLTVVPGMMKYKDADIQILDVPGIISEAEKGRGRGREVLSVARGADLIVLITDVDNSDILEGIRKSLYDNGIRLDQKPPEVVVEKKLRGNVAVHTNILQDLTMETIIDVAKEFGYKNAEITIREKLTMDTLIDAFASNRAYLPSVSVINKVDKSKKKFREVLMISAEKGSGIQILKEKIWDSLKFVRVYLVRKEEQPSMDNPIVMRKDQKLIDVANEIGTEFAEGKKKAKVWGTGAKFPGQIVSLSKEIKEGMQVRFV
ncbi:GTPase [Patescibacteria group bacterium]